MTTEMSTYEQQALDFLASTGTAISFDYEGFKKYFSDDSEQRNVWKVTLQNDKHKYCFDFGSSSADSCKQIEKPQSEVCSTISVNAGLQFLGKNISVGVSLDIEKKNGFTLKYEEVEKIAAQMEDEYYRRVSANNKKWQTKFNNGDISRKEMLFNMENKAQSGAFIQCVQKAIKRECEKLVPAYVESNEKTEPTAYSVLACLTKYDPGTFSNFCGDFGYDEDSRKAYKTYKAVMKEWKNVELLFTAEQLELLQEIQ